MLIGEYESTIGPKNRVSVPKKYRLELGDQLIAAKWYEKCIVLVSVKEWERLLGKLRNPETKIVSAVRDTERFILGSAFEVKLDSQGRFVIPTQLKNYGKLNQQIVFLGLGDRVEIWNKTSWEEKETMISEEAAALLERIGSQTDA